MDYGENKMICKKCKTQNAPHMHKCFACGYTKLEDKPISQDQENGQTERNNEAFYDGYKGEVHE